MEKEIIAVAKDPTIDTTKLMEDLSKERDKIHSTHQDFMRASRVILDMRREVERDNRLQSYNVDSQFVFMCLTYVGTGVCCLAALLTFTLDGETVRCVSVQTGTEHRFWTFLTYRSIVETMREEPAARAIELAPEDEARARDAVFTSKTVFVASMIVLLVCSLAVAKGRYIVGAAASSFVFVITCFILVVSGGATARRVLWLLVCVLLAYVSVQSMLKYALCCKYKTHLVTNDAVMTNITKRFK